MGRTRSASAAIMFAVAVSAGCSGADTPAPPPDGIVLQARAGTYNDGSGRLGVALLTTVRERGGAAPASGASVALIDPTGEPIASFNYLPADARYEVSWWPGIAPFPGTYEVVAEIGTQRLSTHPMLLAGDSLLPPDPDLSGDGATLTWSPVLGAASYACRVYASGTHLSASVGVDPECDVSGLPPGAYAASVVALTVDLVALSKDGSNAPALPARFDVSQASIAFVRGTGESPAILRGAGGAYDDGTGPSSLAIWVSLANPDETPVAEPWTIHVVGPGLPPDAPLAFTYHANFPRLLVWAPGVPAAPGTYTLTASTPSAATATRFVLGDVGSLEMPTGLDAVDGAQGSARATWDAAVGALSYLATAYDAATGTVSASQWTAGTFAEFPADTFTPGRTYDVYVAACDADMVGGAVPVQFVVAENIFGLDSFVAR